MAQDTRIPAWKRLGLKLVGSKRPAEVAFSDQSEPNQDSHSVADRNIQEQHEPGNPTPTSKKRKSVSFSPDSKPKDGSTTQLLLDEFINSQQGGPDQFTPEEASHFGTRGQPRAKNSKTKPQSKGKKIKIPKLPSDVEEPTPSYIAYLVQFHTDKEGWKFNKSKQTQLLKHIFDINSPLTEHMDELVAYLEGLKGQEARNRLKTTALEIAELSDAAKDTLRQELLNTKVRMREAADLEDAKRHAFKEKLRTRERALRILIALNRDVPVEQVPRVNLNGGDVEDEREGAQTNRLAKRALDVNTPDGPVLKRQRIRLRNIRTTHPDDDLESVSSVDSIPTADRTLASSGTAEGTSVEDESTEEEEESSSEESSSEEESSEEESSDEEGSSSEEESSASSEEDNTSESK